MLKNKKYFSYFSKNPQIFKDIGLERIREENPAGFKTMEKLLQEIQTKLGGEFESQDAKGDGFDLNLIE